MHGAARMQTAAAQSRSTAQPNPRVGTRRLYTWAAIVAAAAALAGFSRTYFLRPLFISTPLPGIVHVHGAVMTLWLATLLLQTRLVAMRRVDLHRKVGVAGAVLALLVTVLGVATAIDAARRGATPGPPPLVFLVVPMADITVFATLAGLGLYFRRKPEIHRRLMLLSTLGILPAAFARISLIMSASWNPLLLAFVGTDVCLIAALLYDWRLHRRFHPAFVWGVLFAILSQPLRLAAAQTGAWMAFAKWVVG